MKQPREVPPATFSALGLVCSSKTMAGRESRKYSSTYESSLYVGSVFKVLLDHRRSSNSKQSVGLSARLSSCDELPRPTDDIIIEQLPFVRPFSHAKLPVFL
eukprot:scaffold39324_cov28-Phaeocystis_antarctica.AAC.1